MKSLLRQSFLKLCSFRTQFKEILLDLTLLFQNCRKKLVRPWSFPKLQEKNIFSSVLHSY